MNMGQKIKTLRMQQNMTLEELGNKVGVGKSTVRKWETGIIENMKRDKIAKVARVLGVTPSYLMGWDDNEESQTSEHPIKNKLELIEISYGKSVKDALDLYIHLDPEDQGEIRGEMKQMLKAEKYSAKKSKHA